MKSVKAGNVVRSRINHKHETVQVCVGTKEQYLLFTFPRKQTGICRDVKKKKIKKKRLSGSDLNQQTDPLSGDLRMT